MVVKSFSTNFLRISLLLLAGLVACGPKKAPVSALDAGEPLPAAEQPAEAGVPTTTEATEAAEAASEDAASAEAAAEPQAPVANADLKVKITRADGTTVQGHVSHIERSTDWFGEEDWILEPDALLLTLEGQDKEVTRAWKDVRNIQITPGKVTEDVDCSYDSNYTPWMYDCTLRTTAEVTTSDGTRWTALNRQEWRFSFDDGTEVTFWLKKYPVREQDGRRVDITDAMGENYALYEELQDRMRLEVKTLVTRITITP